MEQSPMDSTSHFPLLDGRINAFLKQILQKMGPAALSTVRELSSTVDHLLMEEGRRRNIYVTAVRLKVNRTKIAVHHRKNIYEGRAATLRSFYCYAEGLSSTSLLFHKHHSDCTCFEQAREYWARHIKEISAGTVMMHLAGTRISSSMRDLSDAQDFIDAVTPFQIRINSPSMSHCSPTAVSQLLSHFQPSSVLISEDNSQGEEQKIHEIVSAHIYRGNFLRINIYSRYEFPGRVVEAYLKCFQQNETGSRPLCVNFSENSFPSQITLHGMQCHRLHNSYQSNSGGMGFFMLLRTTSSPPRHVLLRGRTRPSSSMTYTPIIDRRDLLQKLGSIPHLSPYDFTPSQYCEIFNAPNWPRFA